MGKRQPVLLAGGGGTSGCLPPSTTGVKVPVRILVLTNREQAGMAVAEVTALAAGPLTSYWLGDSISLLHSKRARALFPHC